MTRETVRAARMKSELLTTRVPSWEAATSVSVMAVSITPEVWVRESWASADRGPREHGRCRCPLWGGDGLRGHRRDSLCGGEATDAYKYGRLEMSVWPTSRTL